MTDLRCLTIKPPWARAVAEGVKNIENRSAGFPKHYRGDLIIHSGKGWSWRGASDPRMRQWYGRLIDQLDPVFRYGEAIAVCEVADIHPDTGCCEPWGEHDYQAGDGTHVGQVTHLVLENVRLFDVPVPCAGRLGLWWPSSPDVAADLLAAVAAA